MVSFSFLSICSGLEGASLAFAPLGARCVGVSEIEPFPSAIIAHRHGSNMPGEPLSKNAPPNFGDFTTIPVDTLGQVDVLIGGTPCQAFSVAGKRLSLADARGNLTLAYAVLAHELVRHSGLRNAIWENVPGCLSTKDNAFGCFLGELVGADAALRTPDGGSWPNIGMVAGPRARAAWRVLDAQFFGVPQRRRRVFLVVDFGNGADPAKVLFEPKSLRGDSAPSGKARKGAAATLTASAGGCSGKDGIDGRIAADDVAATLEASHGRRCGQPQFAENLIASTGDISHCLNAGGMGRQDYETETLVAHALRGEGFDASKDGTGRGTPIVPVAFQDRFRGDDGRGYDRPPPVSEGVCGTLETVKRWNVAFTCKDYGGDASEDLAPTLRAMPHDETHANGGGQLAVAFDLRGRDGGAQFEGPHDTANIRAASGGSSRSYLAERWAVRRLTPRECERLQGVPDDFTAIPWRGKPAADCPDGPRYKALGNGFAIPVVRWIGERLAAELARDK